MAKFKATVDVSRAQDRLLLFLRVQDTELSRAVTELGQDAVDIFAAFAPDGQSGRLGRGIRLVSQQGRGGGGRFASGKEVAIVASARNPQDGYDYVGVTRFGHRVDMIEPRGDRTEGRRAAIVLETGKPRRTRTSPVGRPALRIPSRGGGKPLYRGQVKGVRVSSDWAKEAMSEVKREADTRHRALGRRLEMTF